MITIETLCPASLRDDANHLAACKGLSAHDLRTFGNPTHGDYILVGAQVSEDWLKGYMQPPKRPVWDVDGVIDMDAALRAYSALSVLESLPDEPLPLPTGVVVFVGTGLASAYGLQRNQD